MNKCTVPGTKLLPKVHVSNLFPYKTIPNVYLHNKMKKKDKRYKKNAKNILLYILEQHHTVQFIIKQF